MYNNVEKRYMLLNVQFDILIACDEVKLNME